MLVYLCPSIINLARVPLEGVFEVLAYQFDDAHLL